MEWKRLFGFGKRTEYKENIGELAIQLGFTEEALNVLNRIAKAELTPFYRSDLYSDGVSKAVGLSLQINEGEAERTVMELQTELKPFGLLAFICEGNGKKSRVGIIKGQDQFDILKVQQTNGDNYDISNEDVITKLRIWHHKHPFIIIGADYDWVEAIFTEIPDAGKIKAFAKELYKFCPDIVDQGTGTVEELIEELNESGRLYLWWD